MEKLKLIAPGIFWMGFLLCQGQAPASAASLKIDFEKDIQPLLKNKCSRCHSGHKRKGGFSIDHRAAFLQDGESGPAVVSGKSATSLLIELATSKDPDERMPSKGKPLTTEEISLLRAWIDQGLAWPKGFSFTQWRRAPMAPRKVELPRARRKRTRLTGWFARIGRSKKCLPN